MEFIRYTHLERFGTNTVQGINDGLCYVFPKLDGTNASVWWDGENGTLRCASRNRELDIHNDNAEFMNWAIKNDKLIEMCKSSPTMRFYGEWLVPHTIKGYKEDAWRKLYIFEAVEDCGQGEVKYVSPESLTACCQVFGIDYIPLIAKIDKPTYEDLLKISQSEDANFLIDSSTESIAEGIVIKNYEFKNRYGGTAFAKIINGQFHEVRKDLKGKSDEQLLLEEQIAKEFVTQHQVDKVIAKITTENGGISSKDIPRLLGEVWYDLIQEEMWEILKKYKNPRIDFKVLNKYSNDTVKKYATILFGK